MNNQAVFNIAEICARHGITDVILSPGSRSAPLTLAFARHPAYRGKLRVVPDERAAAFIGLGIAQATRRTVVLVCTSGTAGLNYAPAVAEAFFQQIPLLVLTADRPPEWVDQLDGQTIRQRNLYGAHAKGAFDFPVDTSHPDAKWYAERIINEAINLTQAGPAGPVQVNIPLREPFYPKPGEEIEYEQEVKIIREAPSIPRPTPEAMRELLASFDSYSKIIFVFGQQSRELWPKFYEQEFEDSSMEDVDWPVFIGDAISNIGSSKNWYNATLHMQDVIFLGASQELRDKLKPDLLITTGLSLISKSLKQFLRQCAPKEHWHIQAAGEVANTFKSLTKIIRANPVEVLSEFWENITKFNQLPTEISQERFSYAELWGMTEVRAHRALFEYTGLFYKNQTFNEFTAFYQCLQALPQTTALHLANSMAVRYANILSVSRSKQIEVFANRGTSGIDGCNSTAVGAALAQPERPVVLLTGDVAFFYDRNAFWHNYPTPNLRVVLFNNHGGGIFRLIDGPRDQPELDEFFETTQALTAENLCRDFKLRYFPVVSFTELDTALPVFFAAEGGAAVLEIFTDSRTNAAFFEEYRKAVKQAFSA